MNVQAFRFPRDLWYTQRVKHKAEGERYDFVGFKTFEASAVSEAEQIVEFLHEHGVPSAFVYHAKLSSRVSVIADLKELDAFRLLHMPEMRISTPERTRYEAVYSFSAADMEQIRVMMNTLHNPGATITMSKN